MTTQTEALKLALELLAVGTFHSPELQAKRTEVIEQGLNALAQPEPPDLDAICQDLQEKTYNQAMRIAELEAQLAQPEQEPVAYIHRNEYNEYRLEPHDNFDIKSIPFNVDVSLFKLPQRKPLTITEESAWDLARYVYARSSPHESPQILLSAMEIKQIIEAAHGIKE